MESDACVFACSPTRLRVPASVCAGVCTSMPTWRPRPSVAMAICGLGLPFQPWWRVKPTKKLPEGLINLLVTPLPPRHDATGRLPLGQIAAREVVRVRLGQWDKSTIKI